MVETNIASDKTFDDDELNSPASPQPTTKLSIIDHELNRHGMGRYHWFVWVACATGFLLDSLWMQAYSLVLPNVQREFGFSDKDLGNLNTVFFSGMTVGAFLWGTVIDIVGRRVAFYGTVLMAGVFGLCIGAISSFSGLQALVFFVGMGSGGNIPTNATITLEYLPQDRYYLVTALAVLSQVGAVLCAAITYGFVPNYSCSPNLVSCHLTGGAQPCCSKGANMGWRYVFFTVSSISLLIFVLRFFVFPFYESPKYLVSKGYDRAAVEVIQKIAAFNKRSCDLTVESLEKCDEAPVVEPVGFSKRVAQEISRFKLFFNSWKMARVTILLWIIWMFDYGSTGIALSFLPIILQRKNVAVHVSLKQTYIDYIIINSPGIVSGLLAVLMIRIPTIGRKWTLMFASIMMSVSLFLYTRINTQASHVGFNTMFSFFQYLFNAALWGWTPEAYPTAIRGTAAGMAMVIGFMFLTLSPLIGAQLLDSTNGSDTLLYVAGGGVLVCTLALLCLRTKDMVGSRQA